MSASFWETATYNEKWKDLGEFYSYVLIISKSVRGREASEELNPAVKY